MKIDLIKNIIKQVVCWTLLLQMINISIDPPDFTHPAYSTITNSEDLLIEEIESVYELVAEGVFDKDVPASNEDETDTTLPTFELYFFTRACIKLSPIESPLLHFSQHYNNIPSVHHEPLFQPPKRA